MVIGSLTETYYDSFLQESDEEKFTYEPDEHDLAQLSKRLEKIKDVAENKPSLKWRDKMLLKLKTWARKLENAPKPENGRIAKLLYHVKAFIGKIIKILSNTALHFSGTYDRFAKGLDPEQRKNVKFRTMVNDMKKNAERRFAMNH